jgi:biofilm protein TabA
MIFDDIDSIELYYYLGRPLKVAADFIRRKDYSFQNKQKCLLGSEGMFALLQEYNPSVKEDRSIEAHRKYIDIQFMIEGIEYLGYANKNTLQNSGYDEEHDTEKLTGAMTFLPFHEGDFAVFFPQDAHMPGVKGSGSTKMVKKVVVKVPVHLWKE